MVHLISLLFAVSQFETEFYISGLAPLCDQLVVLSYVKEVSEKTVSFFTPNTKGSDGSFLALYLDQVAHETMLPSSEQNSLTCGIRSEGLPC